MTPMRRRWLLGALLVLSAGLAFTDRPSTHEGVVRNAERPSDTRAAAADAGVAPPPDRWAGRQPSTYFDEDAFRLPAPAVPAGAGAVPDFVAPPVPRSVRRLQQAQTMHPPPAAAPTHVPVATEPSSPADAGPAPPMRAFGRFVDETGVMAFAQIADETRVVRSGDAIGREWRVEAITEHELKLLHGPSRKAVTLPLREGR